jgi:integrase
MSGHVRQRGKKGQWYAVIDVLGAGKRIRRWHKLENCKGKREAEKACERLIAQQAEGTYVDPSRMTVADFLERWIEHMEGQVSPARTSATPNCAAIGRRDGSGGLSARTVTHMHRVLREALQQALRWQLLARNPADAVRPPKVERKQMQVLDAVGTAEMIEAARPYSAFMPILLGALCGLRRGEIAALKWRSVDLDAGQLAVVASIEQTKAGCREKETKSGRDRTVALSTTMIEEPRRHRLEQAQALLQLGVRLTPEHCVVMQADATALQPNSIGHAFAMFLKATKRPHIRFHDLRHSHATQMLAAGVHPKIASERLGHAKVGTTLDLYSHVLPGMQADAAARVDVAIRAALEQHRKPKG